MMVSNRNLASIAPVDASATSIRLWMSRAARWLLAVIVLGFALIGFLHVTRGTAVRGVRGVASDGIPIAVGEPEFPVMVAMATGAALSPGNRVEVLQDGQVTYPRLWDDLRTAKQSITLQLYYGARTFVAS
jgi:cardiolipin synthase